MSDPADLPVSNTPVRCVQIGEAVCDLNAGLIRCAGREDRLEPRLTGVLALLIQRAPGVISRDEFLDLVWDGEGSDEALTQSISRLRRLLGDAKAIRTHPRIGYSLAEGVKPVGFGETGTFPARVSVFGLVRRNTGWAVAAGLILAIGGVSAARLLGPSSDREIEFIVQDAEPGQIEFEILQDGN